MNLQLSIVCIFIIVSALCGAAAYAVSSLIWAIITRIEKRKKDRQAKWRH